jgi:RNA polymerase sigma-70 factor (ECF subfamily)
MTAALLLALASPDEERSRSRSARTRDDSREFTRDTTDAPVVASIRAGDTAAFDTLFARLWPQLWRFASSELRDDVFAEDVVQDVFVRVWARRAAWDPGASIQAYFFRAIRNVIINRRKHDRIVRSHAARASDAHRESVIQTNDPSERADIATRLDAALARLSDDQRLAITLRYEHSLRYADIAAVLGVSAPAAEKRVLRALASLRAWITG